ncbi:MAG TPA: EAL domain-containing protein [Burkholderiaceae bacterium]|jgi:c-di-GMP phosphodiesterase|nr:EAL domain-containing protein [Burkholderiaceae bacterium]
MTDTTSSAFLGRQPILNQQHQLVGYELLYRANSTDTSAEFADAVDASLNVIASLLQHMGVEQVLGGKTAFVNIGTEALAPDSPLELLDPKRTVLEVAVVSPDEVMLERLQQLKSEGYGLAVTLTSPATLREPVFPLATHVKLDLLRVPVEQLALVVKLVRNAPGSRRTLVAEKVETAEQARACLAAGVDCLQGYYFARPETLTIRKIEPSRVAVMNAIRLLLRNADVTEIDASLKRDVALSIKLLRYMNSAGMGLACEVESLKHAIQLLGYSKLARWLTLLLATIESRDPTAPLLARTAITRGRFLELLGESRFEPKDRDNLFIAGTFSLLPAMLLVPMDKALDGLRLPQQITDGLLHRTGEFAPYLELAEACEDPNLTGVAKLCQRLELSPRALNSAHTQAIAWVEQLGI